MLMPSRTLSQIHTAGSFLLVNVFDISTGFCGCFANKLMAAFGERLMDISRPKPCLTAAP